MNTLVDQMNELNKKDKVEENLFVKNIIVNIYKILPIKFTYLLALRYLQRVLNLIY